MSEQLAGLPFDLSGLPGLAPFTGEAAGAPVGEAFDATLSHLLAGEQAFNPALATTPATTNAAAAPEAIRAALAELFPGAMPGATQSATQSAPQSALGTAVVAPAGLPGLPSDGLPTAATVGIQAATGTTTPAALSAADLATRAAGTNPAAATSGSSPVESTVARTLAADRQALLPPVDITTQPHGIALKLPTADRATLPAPLAGLLSPALREIQGRRASSTADSMPVRPQSGLSDSSFRSLMNDMPTRELATGESIFREARVLQAINQAMGQAGPAAAATASAPAPTAPLTTLPNPTTLTPQPVFDLHLPPTAMDPANLLGPRPGPAAPLFAGGGQWMDSIGENLAWMVRHDARVAQVRLWPRDLGMIQLQIRMDSDSVEVAIEASNRAVVDELAEAAPRLRSLLADQGLGLSQLNIDQQSTNGRQQRLFPEPPPESPSTAGDSPPAEDPPDVMTMQPAALGLRLVDVFA